MKIGVLLAVMLVFTLVIAAPEVVEAGTARANKGDKKQADAKTANNEKTSNKATFVENHGPNLRTSTLGYSQTDKSVRESPEIVFVNYSFDPKVSKRSKYKKKGWDCASDLNKGYNSTVIIKKTEKEGFVPVGSTLVK